MTQTALRASKGCFSTIVCVGSHTGSAAFTIGGSVSAAPLKATKPMAGSGIACGAHTAINIINRGSIGACRFARNVERVRRERQIGPAMILSFLLSPHATGDGAPGTSAGRSRVVHRRKRTAVKAVSPASLAGQHGLLGTTGRRRNGGRGQYCHNPDRRLCRHNPA